LRCGWAGQDREGGEGREALVYFFKELGFPVNRIGFEAGPLSQWLHAGLTQAGFETVLLETRQDLLYLARGPDRHRELQ
jgi:transposase